jgi:hypothetical protein
VPIVGAHAALEPDDLALCAQTVGLQTGNLPALIDANAEQDDRENADNRRSDPRLPRLRLGCLRHIRARDERSIGLTLARSMLAYFVLTMRSRQSVPP